MSQIIQTKYKEKKIKFNNIIHLVLIPNLDYYNDYLKKILWWNEEDYNNAIYSCNMEINKFLISYPNTSIEQAKKFLYQPKTNIKCVRISIQ